MKYKTVKVAILREKRTTGPAVSEWGWQNCPWSLPEVWHVRREFCFLVSSFLKWASFPGNYARTWPTLRAPGYLVDGPAGLSTSLRFTNQPTAIQSHTAAWWSCFCYIRETEAFYNEISKTWLSRVQKFHSEEREQACIKFKDHSLNTFKQGLKSISQRPIKLLSFSNRNLH